ncbi:MAG: hypothetical protein ACRYGF_17575 [Janthinobacterium lividum]
MKPIWSQTETQGTQTSAQVNSPLDQYSALVNRLVLLVVVLCCAWIFSVPLRSHGSLLGFAQDDLYYYLKAAQNLASGHGSAFDGTTLTNGYHPLYFLMWTCASFFVHSLRGIFRLLWVLDVVSAVTIFLAARRIFRRISANAVLSNAFAVIVMAPCIATISFQMEVTLALPFGFAFLATGFVPPELYTSRRCALLGLLGALTMLARLDAGIIVCLFLLGLLIVRAMRSVLTVPNIAAFSLTSLPPLCIYFFLNVHYFHEWLPISGSAKQLRHGWKPDVTQLRLSFAGFSLVFLAILIVGCFAALRMRKRLRPQEQTLCIAALGMPITFYTLEIFVSVWKLWGWYMYALRFSLLCCAALALIGLCGYAAQGKWPLLGVAQQERCAWVLLVVALIILTRTHYRLDGVMFKVAEQATQLNTFAATHPGRYAMGDRAGMFGYLSALPLIQTEGLMMDRGYLQHIRREDDLVTTLARYHVDYYVQFVFDNDLRERVQGNCLRAQEPSQAGKDAMRMRSTLCSAPVAVIPGRDGTDFVYRISQQFQARATSSDWQAPSATWDRPDTESY